MSSLKRELSVGLLHPRESLFNSGSLAVVNAEVIVAADGAASFSLDLRGTFVATIAVEGSVDGTNWTAIIIRPFNQAAIRYAAAATTAGIWVGKCGHFRLIRARCSAFTSGAAVTTVLCSIAPLDDSLQGIVTTDVVTAVGVAGAAVTLTLPSPGVGLRHYLPYLAINRIATAALVASATLVTVTTTNLPGALAFSFGSDAAPQGFRDSWREDFAYPLAASAQNAATTIVAPATTGVAWRLTAGYYLGQ